MTNRSVRRALERKTRKQARKDQQQTFAAAANLPVLEEENVSPEIEPAVTAAQLAANRQNAKWSPGPITPEGKARASRNALKTGLTGRTILLPTDDAELYDHHIQSIFSSHKPEGEKEVALAQSIADAQWRLARIPTLESGIYALGRLQFAEEFKDHLAAEAAVLIEAKTFLTYQRQLNNLSIQESRLRRQVEKDTARLTDLQTLRLAVARRKAAAAVTIPAPHPFLSHEDENGFEFSTASFDYPNAVPVLSGAAPGSEIQAGDRDLQLKSVA